MTAGQAAQPAATPGTAPRDEDGTATEPERPATFEEMYGEWLADDVLEPNEPPTNGETAAAAVAVSGFATALGTMQALRARRAQPRGQAPEAPPDEPERRGGGRGGGILPDPATFLEGKAQEVKDRWGRDILRKAKVPPELINGIDNPAETVIALARAVSNPRELGRTVRETLKSNPRAVENLLNRHGISTPLIAALGGPERIVRVLAGFARNPIKGIGDFFKDAGRNIANPKLGLKRLGNAVVRVVRASPAGILISIFERKRR